MSYKKALVAYDGSEYSKNALEAALELIESALVRDMVVLYVAEHRSSLGEATTLEIGVPIVLFTQEEHDVLSKSIAEQTKGFEDAVELIVEIGSPKDQILRTAKECGCDLIVMGSRGLGALRSLLGSVSYGVLRDAEVPVLIVK